MHKVVAVLGPTFAKIILASLFNPTMGAIGGSLISIAANHFKDSAEARKAAKLTEGIGAEIAIGVMEALVGDGATNDELDIVSGEMEQLLRGASLSSILIDASMNAVEISEKLQNLKKPIGLNDREVGYLNLGLKISSGYLRKLAPALSGYALERDEVILSTLKALAENYASIKENDERIRETCETILAEVEGVRSQEERDFTRYKTTYLRQIENLLNYVEVLGLEELPTDKQDADLSVAYLSLTLTDRSNEETGVDFSSIVAKARSVPIRLLIEGGAGSGKSTLLRWAATNLNSVEIASSVISWLNEPSSVNDFVVKKLQLSEVKPKYSKSRAVHDLISFPIAPVTRTRVGRLPARKISIDSSEFSHKSPFMVERLLKRSRSDDRVPILVRLREVGDSIPDVSEIHRQVSKSVQKAPAGWIDDQLISGRAVVMFDGIDEVPIGASRDRIIAQIAEFAKVYSKSSVIVTSRPGAFRAASSHLSRFDRAAIEDLDARQQEQFIQNWHAAWSVKFEVPKPEMELKREKLLKRIDDDKAFRRMATNPLICAAICALHEHDEENLPKDERGLCEGLTRMLVERRDRSQGISSAPIDLNKFGSAYQLSFDRKKVVLARIAAEMLRSGGSSIATSDLMKVLPETIFSIGKTEGDVASICAALVERSGVLRASSKLDVVAEVSNDKSIRLPEGVEFIHNRFKEWLASTFFISRGTANELIQRADEEGMAEACFFAAAAPDQLAFSRQLIEGLLERAAGESSHIVKRKLRVLALRCANAAPSLPSVLRKSAEALGSKLLPPKSLEEARALSELGDIATERLQPGSKQRNANEVVPIIRCLSLIDTPESRKTLLKYKKDKRWTVISELSKAIAPSEIPQFVSSLHDFQKVTSTSLRIRKRCKALPKDFFSKLKGDFLDLSGTQVSSILGISKAESLKFIDLSGTPIEFFEELKELPNLESLLLSSCDLRRLDGLNFNPDLKQIVLSGFNADNIVGLDQCPLLSWFSINSSKIKDLSLLASSKNLQTLYVEDCTDVQSWQFLTMLENLQILSLSYSRFDRCQLLSNLLHLRSLSLNGSKHVDCANLSELSELKHLVLHHCEISNEEALSNLTGIIDLDFGRSNLDSIGFLEGATKVTSLGLHGTGVTDISAVAGMPDLEKLFIGATRVQSLEPLRGLRKLQHLVVSDTSIEDFSPVAHLKNLTILQ